MRLTELTKEIEELERQLAPGSETPLWGRYLDRMRETTDLIPYSARNLRDNGLDADVPQEEADWWLTAYRALAALQDRIASLPSDQADQLVARFWEELDTGEAWPDCLQGATP